MLKPVSCLKSFTIIGILTLSLLLNGALLLLKAFIPPLLVPYQH